MQQSFDLNEALIFVSVVEAGTMTAAAERLGIQKSTVSRKIAAMEERIGMRLIYRSTRRSVLTDIGEGHYERCKSIVQAFEDAENMLQQHKEEPAGRLKIIVPIEVGQLYFANFLGGFVQKWPKVSLDVELTSRAIDFREEGISLAIRLAKPNDLDLICKELKSIRTYLVASPDYVKEHPISHPKDLESVNCITLRSVHTQEKWAFTRGLEVCEVKHKSNLNFNNVTAAREAAIAGAGVAQVPNLILEKALQKGSLIHILPEWSLMPRDVYAIYPARRFMPLALSTLLEELEEYFKTRG
ncbi:LysR family transcriptional regulator [Sansalvadorimonas verongulae]|uniref:LysR family transcriptional regulator n=1 Tax=Sansalvadorimonas verongulae TaxID=2172824 RepID=UPI0012BCFC51|nr:LysR family transcriptional regulator [Sansalvadorimonas verongulae]MTI13579.1 LysR family transcriptional regulator [Sansalvadorimonas verongulae]